MPSLQVCPAARAAANLRACARLNLAKAREMKTAGRERIARLHLEVAKACRSNSNELR